MLTDVRVCLGCRFMVDTLLGVDEPLLDVDAAGGAVWALSPFVLHALSFLLVGLLWGGTNPFIKLGSQGVEDVKGDTLLSETARKVFFLATRWRYMLPFALNQMGSVVYFYTLGQADLSLAVPIANSITFVCTAAIAYFVLGERAGGWKTAVGCTLVLSGITLCVAAKAW